MFRFRLQPVLEMRRREERERQREVAALEGERASTRAQIAGIESRERASRDELTRILGEPGDGVDLSGAKLQANASLHERVRSMQLRAVLDGIETRLSAARARLGEAAARRRGIELLRDRQEAVYKAALAKREQSTLDDITGAAAARATVPLGGGER